VQGGRAAEIVMSESTINRSPVLDEATLRPSGVAASAARLPPLDALRGVLMIVMALDHANLFIAREHSPGERWSDPLPRYESALAFLTRFVTHLAAPGFFFLLGAGMVLFAESRGRLGWSYGAIARKLIVRGLLLIALQLLVENPAWQLGEPIRLTPVYIGVLYALGGAMIVGALLVRLGAPALLATGLVAVAATHLLLPAPSRAFATVAPLARLLLIPGLTQPIVVNYPLIPWLGIACLGMAFGRWLLADRAGAYRWSLPIGGMCLLSFAAVRWLGGFGNIRPADGAGWIAFLNVVKYPPSLAFILLTLGVDLAILGLLARAGAAIAGWGRPLLAFGRSPLFFYIAHLYLYGLIGLAIDPNGIGIARMYPFWLAGLAALYFLCGWFGAFKQRQAPDSPWRLF
jgi:uncharacterized membrane protein